MDTVTSREREGKEEGVEKRKRKRKTTTKYKKVKAAVGRNRTPVSSELLFLSRPLCLETSQVGKILRRKKLRDRDFAWNPIRWRDLNNHYDTKENTKKSTNLLKTSWALHEQLLLKDCLDLWG